MKRILVYSLGGLAIILSIVFLSLFAQTEEDPVIQDQGRTFYTVEEQQQLFLNNQYAFNHLVNVIVQSKFKNLWIRQDAGDCDLRWGNTDGPIEGDEISPEIYSAVETFFISFACHSIDVNNQQITIQFWDEIGNNGLQYRTLAVNSSEKDFYTELADNWYWFQYPTV